MACAYTRSVCVCSVHLKQSEKMVLVAGRDGGLQNMEILGIIMLRISDPEYGMVKVAIDNQEQRSVQFQVCVFTWCVCVVSNYSENVST